MAIFDIDEMINDPWGGLRNTDAYINYVLEEVHRLFEGGELEEVSYEVFVEYMFGEQPDCEPSAFIFDGREFNYLYYKDKIAVCCEEWEKAKWFGVGEWRSISR